MTRGDRDETAPVTADLRILATTDLHAHLLPHDYYADRPQPATGLAQAARLIRRLRAEAPGGVAILLDNGDTFQGSLLSDRIAAANGDRPHPMAAAMNLAGYDAGTLGNHEFNHGLPFLRAALHGLAFPVVSSNLRNADGTPFVAPSTRLDRVVRGSDGQEHAIRIGILGVAPPQIARWDALVLGGAIRVRPIVETAQEEARRLRAEGADLVVALCHSGIGDASPDPDQENAALPLAALPGIDAVILGHTHRVFPGIGWPSLPGVDPVAGTLHGTPAVQAGAYGSHVGVIDLALRHDGGRWRVTGHRVRAEPVPLDTPVDDAIAAMARPHHRWLRAVTGLPVGATRVPLHSHFALVAPDPALDVVADALRSGAARMLEGTEGARLPVLTAVAPFKAGGRGGPTNYIDIPPGPVALRQAAELYIHPNTFAVVEITGAGLRDWLERSVSIFQTLTRGDIDQPLLRPDLPSYNFDVIDGLSWTVDPTQPPRTDGDGQVIDPAARRVGDLRHNDRPVRDGDRFALVTNSFRLGSGGGFASATTARPLVQSTVSIRDLVQAHLRGSGPLAPLPRPRWRFAAHPGTAAWFDSAPAALAHHAQVESRRIEPLHPTPEGFHRFRLWL